MNPTKHSVSGARVRLVDAVFILFISLLCVIASYKLKLDHNAELIGHMHGTVRGHPWGPEFQNRLLAPLMLDGLGALTWHHIADEQIYKIIRVFSALFGFGTVYYCTLLETRSYSRSLLAAGLCAYGYLWTALTFFMEYPDDFFDIGFTYLLCWLCVRNLAKWLLPVMLLACLNRESGVFGGVIYACLQADVKTLKSPFWRPVLLGLGMTVTAYLFVNGVRYAYAHQLHQFLGITNTIKYWRYALQPFGWVTCIAGMFSAVGLLLWKVRNDFTEKSIRLMIAAGFVLVPTVIVGIVSEIRICLPLYCLLVFALIESGLDRIQPSWQAASDTLVTSRSDG